MATSEYPILHLLPSSTRTVAIAGSQIFIIDSNDGNVLVSIKSSSLIRCAVLDSAANYLATISEDKMLRLWRIESGSEKPMNEREMPKRATCVHFLSDSQTVVVSDKFGDVFSYPLKPEPSSIPAPKPKGTDNPPAPKDSLISHPSMSGGTLVLGHTSLLTTFLLTADERYIITADRDEHIRVSWYPQGYNIESYCLGSTQFVSALHVPSQRPDVLLSGGGDPELMVWNWMTGNRVAKIPIWPAVRPSVLVLPPQWSRRSVDADDGGGVIDVDIGQGSGTPVPVEGESSASAKDNVSEPVLAVHKIASVRDTLLFSVVGGSTLFAVPLKTALDDNTSSEDVATSSYQFGLPILEFAVSGDKVLVSLDTTWQSGTEPGAGPGDDGSSRRVRAVRISDGGQIEVANDDPVAKTLSSELCRVPREPQVDLNLYDTLKAYPKDKSMHVMEDDPESRRQQGRMKTKKVVLEKQRQSQKRDSEEVEGGENKKAKCEAK